MEIVYLILSESLAGTLLMTLFSYVLSVVFRKRFRKPELINLLIIRSTMLPFQKKERVACWIVHYGIGILFALIYEIIWSYADIPPALSLVLFGTASGAIGILGWQLLLEVSPDPPKVDRKWYYIHLAAAHIVFTCGVVLTHLMWP